MKASELRQSILQAAVQGKLVPQDLHDEPASELLARIRAEKVKLIKEGELRKEKQLPPITEEDIPYDLPEGWCACRITDLVSLYDGSIRRGPFGSAITKDMFVTKGENVYKVYEQGNAIRKTIDYGDYFITQNHYDKLKSFHIVPGDIIISCAGTLGETYVLPDDAPAGIINQALLRLNINKNIITIPYFLLNFKVITQQQIVLSSYGSAMKNLVSIQWLKENAIFPLPPIAEQKRIVTKVNELMALCDQLEAAENELETLETHFIEYLPKSILQMAVQGKLVPQNLHDEPASELLERIRAEKARLVKESKLKKEKPLPPITEDDIPYDLPEGWVWCRLGELLQFAENNNIHKTLPEDTLINYVDIDSIDNKNYCIKEAKVSPVNKLSSRARRVLEKDYIVYSLVRPYLNNIALIIENKENYIGSTGFAVFKPIYIEVNYLINYLLSPFVEMYFLSILSGFNSPSVSQTDFQKTLFPLPPLAEQRRIVEKTDKLLLLCKELRAAKSLHTSIDESNVVPFPQNAAPEEIDIAARGDAEGLPQEALDDLAELFGDGKND